MRYESQILTLRHIGFGCPSDILLQLIYSVYYTPYEPSSEVGAKVGHKCLISSCKSSCLHEVIQETAKIQMITAIGKIPRAPVLQAVCGLNLGVIEQLSKLQQEVTSFRPFFKASEKEQRAGRRFGKHTGHSSAPLRHRSAISWRCDPL